MFDILEFRMKKALVWIFWLGCSVACQAQWQSERISERLISDKNDASVSVETLGSGGLLVIEEEPRYGSVSGKNFRVTRLDTAFHQRWSAEFLVKTKYTPLLTYKNAEYFYWLCGETTSDDIQIWRIRLDDGEPESIEGTVVAIEEVSDFKVLGNTAFMAGKYHERHVAVGFRFFDKSTQPLSGTYGNYAVGMTLSIDEARNRISVATRTQHKGKCGFHLNTYDYDGTLLRTLDFATTPGKVLVSGRVMRTSTGTEVFLGSYSANCSEIVQGICVARLAEENYETPKYIPLPEIPHFFNYLEPTKRDKQEKRYEEQKNKGSEPRFAFKMLFGDPVALADGGFAWLGDTYSTQLRQAAIPAAIPMRLATPDRPNVEAFDFGFSVLMGFDAAANLRWGNALAYKEMSAFTLESPRQVLFTPDTMYAGYLHKEKLRSHAFTREQTPQVYENEIIPKELADSSDDSVLLAWYDDNFILWGTKTTPKTDKKSIVLYRLGRKPTEPRH